MRSAFTVGFKLGSVFAGVLLFAGIGSAQKGSAGHTASAPAAAARIAPHAPSASRPAFPTAEQSRTARPTVTGNYLTGAAPQPGYSVGVTPGVLGTYNNGRNQYSRHRSNYGFYGAGVFPGYLGYTPDLNTFPGYAASGYAPDAAPPAAADPNTQALAEAQMAMADQLRDLTAQLADLRAGNTVIPEGSPATNASEQEATPIPLQVILRNGQQFPVKNYAVMNGELWDFSGQRVRKIPVDSIDVPASVKATEAGGGQFPALHPAS